MLRVSLCPREIWQVSARKRSLRGMKHVASRFLHFISVINLAARAQEQTTRAQKAKRSTSCPAVTWASGVWSHP